MTPRTEAALAPGSGLDVNIVNIPSFEPRTTGETIVKSENRTGSLRHRAAALLAAAAFLASCQPERPTTGPGSTQNYIATSAAITNAGEATATDNTKVAYYVPNVLKHGTTAPVVVFLHGFQAGDPGLYIAHINHLWHQGYIVVFPMYNTTNAFTDLDQNVMVDRLVRNTNFALANIGTKAELDHVYVYGHSAGAAFGSVFQLNSGITPVGVMLAHPALDTGPVPVPGIVLVNYQVEAAYTTAPVVILTGDQDTIAPPSASVTLHGYLTGAASRIVWEARTDNHEYPPINTDHLQPLTIGNSADTMDWRFYWSALDQMLAGDATPAFDMGSWTSGTPVKTPIVLAN